MVQYKEILKSFNVLEADKDNIRQASFKLAAKKDEFIDATIGYIIKRYDLPEPIQKIINLNYKGYLFTWYDGIMAGRVDNNIVTFIMDFNTKELPKNYYTDDMVASIFSFIRQWFQTKVFEVAETEWEFNEVSKSFIKLVDVSMYFVSRDYNLYKYGKGMQKHNILDNVLRFTDKFSTIVHMVIVFFLICMTIGGLSYFVYNLKEIASVGMDKFFITSLGSLLVIWVLIELLHSEVQTLRGAKFRISIFVGVALIAFIRDLLIMTLQHDANKVPTILLLAGIFVLGVTYFMLSRVENKQ